MNRIRPATSPKLNLPLHPAEVPDLREAVGWSRRDEDYPALLERCQFWAGARNREGLLIAFGYLSGMGLQHGYMEDILVHPAYRKQGIGRSLVRLLLEEAQRTGIEIVSLTCSEETKPFYASCGMRPGAGAVWRNPGSDPKPGI